jgi:hypothetical protein
MWVHPTVTASTMIADLNCGGKVRCHNGLVGKIGTTERGPWRQALQNQRSWGSLGSAWHLQEVNNPRVTHPKNDGPQSTYSFGRLLRQ